MMEATLNTLDFYDIYDIPSFKDDVLKLYSNEDDLNRLINMSGILMHIGYTKDILDIILDKADKYPYDHVFNIILDNIIKNKDMALIEQLLYVDNMDVKVKVVSKLINNNIYGYDKLKNIIESFDEKYLDILANKLYDKNKVIYNKIKDYIIKKYPKNSLGINMLSNPRYELTEDVYASSINKLQIHKEYGSRLTSFMNKRFALKNPLYNIGSKMPGINAVYENDLGDKLEEYIEKYMSLSKSSRIEYLSSGSTTDVYRIGDYVIKLSRMKWSLEKDICPNNYLIIKNYEQDFVRDSQGVIIAGIEVQKYLSKDVPDYLVSLFSNALKEEGYYCYDYLKNGPCGNNLKMLDSYLDANTISFSKLPLWFYYNPVVLVDRDLVFKRGSEPNSLVIRRSIDIN